jgi:hypothetical protein
MLLDAIALLRADANTKSRQLGISRVQSPFARPPIILYRFSDRTPALKCVMTDDLHRRCPHCGGKNTSYFIGVEETVWFTTKYETNSVFLLAATSTGISAPTCRNPSQPSRSATTARAVTPRSRRRSRAGPAAAAGAACPVVNLVCNLWRRWVQGDPARRRCVLGARSTRGTLVMPALPPASGAATPPMPAAGSMRRQFHRRHLA